MRVAPWLGQLRWQLHWQIASPGPAHYRIGVVVTICNSQQDSNLKHLSAALVLQLSVLDAEPA